MGRLGTAVSTTSILDTDRVLSALCGVASQADYRVEFGYDEVGDHPGVCVYSNRLIQLQAGLRREPIWAQWTLVHELAHALLHDSFEDDLGQTGAAHEREANTVRKLVWPHLHGYFADYGETFEQPTPEVVSVADCILSALGLPGAGWDPS